MKQLLPIALLTLGFGCASLTTTTRTDVSALVADYQARRTTEAIGPDITMPQALRVQKQFVQALAAQGARRAGYKVGLVTLESQKRFGVTAPVRGVLLDSMLLENGSEVPHQFGAGPLCEADLVVIVKDKGINEATSVIEAARHLKAVGGFIELPDTFIATNQTVTGPMLTAANAGARLGVLGQQVPVEPTLEFVEALANMRITMTDEEGRVVVQTQARTILDHPLHSVLWLVEELNREGVQLKEDDIISLGGVGMVIPRPQSAFIVNYEGLRGSPFQASVSFK